MVPARAIDVARLHSCFQYMPSVFPLHISRRRQKGTPLCFCPQGQHPGREPRPHTYPPSPRRGLCGRGRQGHPSPDARPLVEAPQHSLGCADCHLRADRLLVAQIRAYSRLLSPTPFFLSVRRVTRADDAGAAELQRSKKQPSGFLLFGSFQVPVFIVQPHGERGALGRAAGLGLLAGTEGWSLFPECRDRSLRLRVCLRPPPVATDGSFKLRTPARVLSLLQRNPGVEPVARPPWPPWPRSGLMGGCAEKTTWGCAVHVPHLLIKHKN